MIEQESNLFEIKHNNIPPAKGKVLISMPFLHDSLFSKTTILLLEHNKKGSVGFILNKPLKYKLHNLIEGLPEKDFSVSFGGPVAQDSLHYIHTLADIPGSAAIQDGLFWGGNFDFIKELVINDKINNCQIRFFMGYSGWSSNQLKSEYNQNSWLIGNLSVNDIITGNSNQEWKEMVQSLGGKYKLWADFPDDPILN